MKRDLQGHTVPIVIEGEELQAFVPNPLPPDPPIRPTADLTNISDSALIAMRLLNGVLSALEDHASIAKLLSYLEAVLSCQIDDFAWVAPLPILRLKRKKRFAIRSHKRKALSI